MGCDVDVNEVVEEAVVGFFDVVVSGIVFSDAVDDDGDAANDEAVDTEAEVIFIIINLKFKCNIVFVLTRNLSEEWPAGPLNNSFIFSK